MHEEDIQRVQTYRALWNKVTSRPMTSREVIFADSVRNLTLEQAAELSEDLGTALCGLPNSERCIIMSDDIALAIRKTKAEIT